MERKLYASMVMKNPKTCAAAQKNDQYEYYSSDDVKKIKQRVEFFNTAQSKFSKVVDIGKQLDGVVGTLDDPIKKELFEANQLQLPGNAGEPTLEKKFLDTMDQMKRDLLDKIQTIDLLDGNLRAINDTAKTEPVIMANSFILPLEDTQSMWSAQYIDTLTYNADIKSGTNAPGLLVKSLNNWIRANEFRETQITKLAGLYVHETVVEENEKEKEIRKAYPITYWTGTTANPAGLDLAIKERKNYLATYATKYQIVSTTLGSITPKMIDDGFSGNGYAFPDKPNPPGKPYGLIDAIAQLDIIIATAGAASNTVRDAIAQYETRHGTADNVQLQAINSSLAPDRIAQISALNVERVRLESDYKLYKPTIIASSLLSMTIDDLKKFINDRKALFDKYLKAYNQVGNQQFARSVWGKVDVEIDAKIKEREAILLKASTYYTKQKLDNMNKAKKEDTTGFVVAVNAKILAYDKAGDLGINYAGMKEMDALEIDTLIQGRENVITDKKMETLWVDIYPILKAHPYTQGDGNSDLEKACDQRSLLIAAYNNAGSSKRTDPAFTNAKTLTNADLIDATDKMIKVYTELKSKIITFSGGPSELVGGEPIGNANPNMDNPAVGTLVIVAEALEQDRLRIISNYDTDVVNAVKNAKDIDTISNNNLVTDLEAEKLIKDKRTEEQVYETRLVQLESDAGNHAYVTGANKASIVKNIEKLNDGTTSIRERSELLSKELINNGKFSSLITRANDLLRVIDSLITRNKEKLAELAGNSGGPSTILQSIIADDKSLIVTTPVEDSLVNDAVVKLNSIDFSQIYTGQTPGHDGQAKKDDAMPWLDIMAQEVKQRIGDIIIQELTKTEKDAFNVSTRLGLKSAYDGLDIRKLLMSNRNELMVTLGPNTTFGVVSYENRIIIGSWARFQFNYEDVTAVSKMKILFPDVDFPLLYDNGKTTLTGTLYIKLAVLQRKGESDADYDQRRSAELRQVGDNKFFIEEVKKQLTLTSVGQNVQKWTRGNPSVLRNPDLKDNVDVKMIANIVGLGNCQFTVDGVNEIGIKPAPGKNYSFLYAPSLTGFSQDLDNLGLRHQDMVQPSDDSDPDITLNGKKLDLLHYVFEHFANIPLTRNGYLNQMVKEFERVRRERGIKRSKMDEAFAAGFVKKYAPIPYIQPVDHTYTRTDAKVATRFMNRQYYLQCKKDELAVACSVFGHAKDIGNLAQKGKNLYLYKNEEELVNKNKAAVSATTAQGGSTALMDTDDEDVGSKFRFIPNI